ncbi:MAG: carbon-nitrogen hydrolase family protein [Deltaproteobacteria bacterium]|nr:carbon-nitrogen hydrolase family protein [Deltaproteobacteria bacterium]
MKLVLVEPELEFSPSAENLERVTRLLEPAAPGLGPADVVLLPEHFELREDRGEYERSVGSLARRLGCHVVGGSHHETRGDRRVNSGVAADASGAVVGRYEKLRPYADERTRVEPGELLGELRLGEVDALVMVCADFWFSDLLARATRLPDLLLVPAFSVSRKPTPDFSRALWRHLAVTRAYELAVYVGVSDWAHVPTGGRVTASGVAGLADPTETDPEALYRPVGGAVRVYDLDLGALGRLREDRRARGFFFAPGAS